MVALQHVIAKLLDGRAFHLVRRNGARDDVACVDAVFGDFQNAGVGRPEARNRSAVDARQVENRLRDFVEGLQERLVPDVALGVLQHDDDAVRAKQPVLVLKERVDIGVIRGKALVEACIHTELGGFVTQHDRDKRDDRQHEHAAAEKDCFKNPDH